MTRSEMINLLDSWCDKNNSCRTCPLNNEVLTTFDCNWDEYGDAELKQYISIFEKSLGIKHHTTKTERHMGICAKLSDIYDRKNHDYGDSYSKSFKEYGMIVACFHLEEKLNRLKALTKSSQQVLDESIEDTLMDLANYAIMTLVEREIEHDA